MESRLNALGTPPNTLPKTSVFPDFLELQLLEGRNLQFQGDRWLGGPGKFGEGLEVQDSIFDYGCVG